MEPHRFSFEKLVVWQDAKDLTVKVYQLTREFPSEEKFALYSKSEDRQRLFAPT